MFSMDSVENFLNELLANEQIMNNNFRLAHWNVIGKDFLPVHKFLDDLYHQSAADIDSIAERIKISGFRVQGTLQNYINNSSLTNLPFESFYSEDIFKKLSSDLEEYINYLGTSIQSYNFEIGNENYLLNLLEQKEKTLWLIKSHIL